jgi:hypothetical protein
MIDERNRTLELIDKLYDDCRTEDLRVVCWAVHNLFALLLGRVDASERQQFIDGFVDDIPATLEQAETIYQNRHICDVCREKH